MSTPLIIQIQAEATDNSLSVVSLLRKAKIAATQLDLPADLAWIDRELSGYESEDKLPEYRIVYGDLKVLNPYHGWQTVMFHESSNELADTINRCPMTSAISHIEWLVAKYAANSNSAMVHQLSPGQQAIIHRLIGQKLEAAVHLNPARIAGIPDAVRNLILDWSLRMYKAGIVGDDLVFSQKEKSLAGPVSQVFHVQNVGTIGDIREHAHVINVQNATGGLDIATLKNVVAQIKENLGAAPVKLQNDLRPIISQIDDELATPAPNEGTLRDLVGSARVIAEGAAGNLIASGIVGLLGSIMS